jgi:farnesyl diphosphate synthase
MPTFEQRLSEAAQEIEQTIAALLAEAPLSDEVRRPPRLLAAMRHAALAGGKRFRPFLVQECARLFGVAPAQSAMAAAAVECIHCYSLVHDDLPAMDDDDLRRGVPTVHKAFDEATAILAGDALLTLAFDVLARPQTHPDPQRRLELVSLLARAAGLGGMVGGQMLDMLAPSQQIDIGGVRELQAMKTGALIAAACETGALLGQAAADARTALAGYGKALGRAFQIADDLFDIEASPETLGKATGKDSCRGKATFVTLLGRDGARALLETTVAECERAVSLVDGDTSVLVAAAHFAALRKL